MFRSMNINYFFWINISGNKQDVLWNFFDFCCVSQVLDLPPVANDAVLAIVKRSSHVWEF